MSVKGAHQHRFVLRYRGTRGAPAEDMARIEDQVRILDRTSRMLLVEASDQQVSRLVEALPDWVVITEQAFRAASNPPQRAA
jgi:hypothetical protein